MTDAIWENEKSINEYGEKEPDPEGSVFFRISIKETVTRTYLTTDPTLKTAKAVREQYDEWGTDDWRELDGTEWDGSRISKIEKVVYSPCSLGLQYLTPPSHWTEESHPNIRYLSTSTMFDEQPEGSAFDVFNKDAIRRRYVRCTNYIHGKTSQICPKCERLIVQGWSIIHPLKKEESE
jgi:hypothetical protein|tara:strand:+ start:439 stop:975 length:537 start_codon:yes stop_codon:yes gene_type:complete